jgi:hypothetical protein
MVSILEGNLWKEFNRIVWCANISSSEHTQSYNGGKVYETAC